MTRDRPLPEKDFPPRRTKRRVPAVPPITPSVNRYPPRGTVMQLDPVDDEDLEIIRTKVRMKIFDGFGGTFTKEF